MLTRGRCLRLASHRARGHACARGVRGHEGRCDQTPAVSPDCTRRGFGQGCFSWVLLAACPCAEGGGRPRYPLIRISGSDRGVRGAPGNFDHAIWSEGESKRPALSRRATWGMSRGAVGKAESLLATSHPDMRKCALGRRAGNRGHAGERAVGGHVPAMTAEGAMLEPPAGRTGRCGSLTAQSHEVSGPFCRGEPLSNSRPGRGWAVLEGVLAQAGRTRRMAGVEGQRGL